MVRIRLTRVGKKNFAAYRIVVTSLREKRDSKAIEIVGTYSPHNTTEKKYRLDADRVKYWMSVGAQPSETVKAFLINEGIMDKPTFTKKHNHKPGKKAEARKEQAA
jgi:small subunit ribosomal protein S16